MPSSRNGSFASKVDKMPVAPRRKTLIERASDLNKPPKAKSQSVKGPKSPSSSKQAFGNKAPKPIKSKAKHVKGYFMPAPGRGPRPPGMGENGVNWRVHNMRMKLMREATKGSFVRASGPKPGHKNKAVKLVKGRGIGFLSDLKGHHKDHSR